MSNPCSLSECSFFGCDGCPFKMANPVVAQGYSPLVAVDCEGTKTAPGVASTNTGSLTTRTVKES